MLGSMCVSSCIPLPKARAPRPRAHMTISSVVVAKDRIKSTIDKQQEGNHPSLCAL